MIILYKKRILFINFIIILSVVFHSLTMKDTVTTSSTPVSNHCVIIDAGHGFPDGGASSQNNILEADINLNIALKLQNLLEMSNCTVILTRSDENGIYDSTAKSIREKKISDMKNRSSIAKISNAEIFVSIHMNKISDTECTGWQSFYKNTDEQSKNLANCIQENLNYFIDKNNKRTIKSINNIYLTKNVSIPLVIIECGFLSNSNEAVLLNSDDYQNKLAWCIYTGILDYFQ